MVNQSERGLFETMISGLESEPGATKDAVRRAIDGAVMDADEMPVPRQPDITFEGVGSRLDGGLIGELGVFGDKPGCAAVRGHQRPGGRDAGDRRGPPAFRRHIVLSCRIRAGTTEGVGGQMITPRLPSGPTIGRPACTHASIPPIRFTAS